MLALYAASAVVALFLLARLPVKLYEPTHLLPDGTVSVDGQSPADPRGLAFGLDMTDDAYSLARMVASEAGGLPEIAQIAVAWATKNYVRARGRSFVGVLTAATHGPKGFFGQQSQGRYASTARDSTSTSRSIAESVIRGSVTDPTDGAQQWDSPRAYKDWDGNSSARAEQVAASRMNDGDELVTVPGVDASIIRFWRPNRVA